LHTVPILFGNGIVVGAQPYEVFEKIIRKTLEKDLVSII
jgi:predicted DsbA family dithiol-disulfide isomerase